MPDNINNDFRDFILKRNHFLYRYENGVIQNMVAPYNVAKTELIRQLEKIQATGIGYTRDWRIERLRTQLAEVEAMLQAAAMDSAGELEKATAELAYLEAEIYTQMLRDGLSPIGINIRSLPLRQIDFIVMNPLIYKYRNMTFRDVMLWANNEVVNLMRTTLTQSIVQGEDMTQAANRLIGLGKSLGGEIGSKIISKAKIIARSEIQHISNEVARAIFAENTDVLAGVKFVATLDSRTCTECMDLDGTIYKFKDGADHEGPVIPIHPLCRCIYSPVTKSWAQLEREEGVKVSVKDREYYSGKAADTVTYQKWLKIKERNFMESLGDQEEEFTAWLKSKSYTYPNKFPYNEPLDLLGKNIYRVWRNGDLKFNGMAKSNRALTFDGLIEIGNKKEMRMSNAR